MSTSAPYLASIVDATTMDTIKASLKTATSRSFVPVFDGPGTYSFQVPIDGEAAATVRKRRHGILLKRRDRYIWSGGVTAVNHDPDAEKTSITATGFLEELDHRFVRKAEESALTFGSPGVPGGQIFQTLVDTCNAQEDTDGVVRPVRVSFGGFTDTQVRIAAIKAGTSFGSAWQQFRDVEDGYDVIVDPLTKQITTRDPADFVDRLKVHFGYGVKPNNLSNAPFADDGTTLFNRVTVVDGSGVAHPFDDADAIDAAGVMLEEWQTISQSDGSLADAAANAELVYQRYGTQTWTLTPAPYADMPRPYDDFEWGDRGYLSVSKGALQVKMMAVRIFSANITITDEGDEVVGDLSVTAG